MNPIVCGCLSVLLLAGCSPSEQEKAQQAEKKRIECLDIFCEGDVRPKYDTNIEVATKLNGQWFVGPKEYGVTSGSLAFFWPSKTPANREHAEREAPEFVPSGQGRNSNFYEVGIEIFLRSNTTQSRTSGYKQLQIAKAQGRVINQKALRPGLEVWYVKDEVPGLQPEYWYIATDLKGLDGDPPVLVCRDSNDKNGRCTTGFWWRPHISVDLRFRAKHGKDWPEIYQECIRTLQKLREA